MCELTHFKIKDTGESHIKTVDSNSLFVPPVQTASVVRAPGYRYEVPGSIPRATRYSEKY
jgi:FtsP/CotA-like multicopper oxidase with cupredoxin domain